MASSNSDCQAAVPVVAESATTARLLAYPTVWTARNSIRSGELTGQHVSATYKFGREQASPFTHRCQLLR